MKNIGPALAGSAGPVPPPLVNISLLLVAVLLIVRQLSNRFGDDVDALDKSTNFFYKLLIVLALYFW